MLRRSHRAALAAAALALLGCPGSRSGPPPERFVPARAVAAFVLPQAGRAARELADLHATAAGFPGGAELAGLRGELAAQLGFDPLDPEALPGAGLEPRRGAAAALVVPPAVDGGGARRSALLVLPAGDVSRLEALLSRLARDRLGATERSADRRRAASVVVLHRPGAQTPALAWAIVERTVLVCAGPEGPDVVAEAAALSAEASLAGAPAWRAARSALGEAPAALVHVPAGSPLLAGLWAVKDGLAVGLSAAPGRLSVRAALLLGAREPSFRALQATTPGEGAKAVARLDPAAHLAARFDGDFAALGEKLVPLLDERERRRLAARKLEPRRDLFGVLAPGGALSLSLAPGLEIAGLDAATARADPLRVVELEAVLPVKDADAAEAASARLAGGPSGRGAAGSPDGVHRLRTSSGEIAWRVDRAQGRVIVAGGRPGRLAALERRLAGGPGFEAPTATAKAALSGGLAGAVLDVPRLVSAIRALPDERFGEGPSGFVLRSLVGRLVEPAARLRAVSFRAAVGEGALVLSLDVEAAPEARP